MHLTKRITALILSAVFVVVPVAAGENNDNHNYNDDGAKWRGVRGADENIGDNFWRSHFGAEAFPYHLGAGVAALLLVHSGADADIQRWAAGHDEDVSLAWSAPGLVGGAVAPVLVPGALMLSDDARKQRAGAAALQAAGIALFSTSVLKALTNRRSPEDGVKATNKESRDFRFGFLRQNIWEGFPSGHTATNMAMSAVLAECYRDNPAVRAAAYGWAGYVAMAVAVGDRGGVHWASDVVVGGMLGYVVGKTVAKNCHAEERVPARVSVVPDLRNNGLELVIRL